VAMEGVPSPGVAMEGVPSPGVAMEPLAMEPQRGRGPVTPAPLAASPKRPEGVRNSARKE
jgi:hypothetical protein